MMETELMTTGWSLSTAMFLCHGCPLDGTRAYGHRGGSTIAGIRWGHVYLLMGLIFQTGNFSGLPTRVWKQLIRAHSYISWMWSLAILEPWCMPTFDHQKGELSTVSMSPVVVPKVTGLLRQFPTPQRVSLRFVSVLFAIWFKSSFLESAHSSITRMWSWNNHKR